MIIWNKQGSLDTTALKSRLHHITAFTCTHKIFCFHVVIHFTRVMSCFQSFTLTFYCTFYSTHWALTLKNFSSTATHITIMSAKFHWSPSLSTEMLHHVKQMLTDNTASWMDNQTDNLKPWCLLPTTVSRGVQILTNTCIPSTSWQDIYKYHLYNHSTEDKVKFVYAVKKQQQTEPSVIRIWYKTQYAGISRVLKGQMKTVQSTTKSKKLNDKTKTRNC